MPQKIALLIHAMYGGGAERVMADLASYWSEQHYLDLVTWSTVDTDTYKVPSSVRRHGLGLMKTSRNSVSGLFANLRRVRVLRATLNRLKPDLILSFSDQMNIVALQAARPLRIPIWISEHSNPERQRLGFLWEKWRKSIYPSCTGCVVLNQDIAGVMSRFVPKEKIRVIPNAVVEPRRSAVKREPGTQTVLFVGRLSPEKRVDLLIAAWLEVCRQLPEWRLVIVGDGAERERLQKLTQGESSVAWLGWCSDPGEYYATADLFVLPSEYEGFPVALLEAMSYGVASVATRCSSTIEELNATGESVRAIAVGSKQDLAGSILELARDAGSRSRLATQARETAKKYQWERIGPLWDAILPQN